MPDVMTAEQYAESVRKEYSTYVATQAIDINGARAFNVGDPVPASHVTGDNPSVAESQVAKVTTKAGQSAVSAAVAPSVKES